MTAMTFDKLAYIDRLKAVGFDEPQARGMADALDQALCEKMATRSDLAAFRTEIDLFRAEFKSDLVVLKSEVLAAMKANKLDFLKAFIMLLVAQTAMFTAFDLLGH